jgi:RimJ/RimL family protein N-acetyltransferase
MDTPGPVLEGRFVRLEPLTETHREGLRAACDADPDVWAALYPFPMNGPHLDEWWARLEKATAAGQQRGYAVMHGGQVLGCSTYYLDEPNLRTEIGNTYYRPDARGGAINPEAKMLMLAHAFRPDGLYAKAAHVVQFRVDALNVRSRAAVAKLGAHLDGVIRQDRITWTGRVRDTCVFSILAEEWPMVCDKLEARLAALAAPSLE